MADTNEIMQSRLRTKAQQKLIDANRAEEEEQYKTIIDQNRRYVKRVKHDVRDDVKYEILPKSALVIEPLHKIGVPTGVITNGVIAVSDASAFLTMSDKKLCEYYANYDKITKEKKQSVSNIVKSVDRQEESLMKAKSALASSKLRYSTYKTRLKLQERFGKASGLLTDDDDLLQSGKMTADSTGLDY